MITDVTGTELIPGNYGRDCPGNGEHQGGECCCEECDYMLLCFPDWKLWVGDEISENFEKMLDKIKGCVYNNLALEESAVDMDD